MKRLIYISMLCLPLLLKGQAPAGQPQDLVFWFKADAGTNTTVDGAAVTSWADQSANALASTINGSPPMTYVRSAQNGNPAVRFSGSSHMVLNSNLITNASSNKTIAIVFDPGPDVNTRQVIFEQGGKKKGACIYLENGNLIFNLFSNPREDAAVIPISPDSVYAAMFVWDRSANQLNCYLNGDFIIGQNISFSTVPSDNDPSAIGGVEGNTQFMGKVSGSTGNRFMGDLMEIINYSDRAFDSQEREDLYSYLGAKYGITVDNDYTLAITGNVYWDQAAQPQYHNDLGLIGREDATAFDQRQSKSVNGDALVTIGLGTIAADNASNPNSFPNDNTVFAWGNNDGDFSSFTSIGAPPGQQIISRSWKYQATNTVGSLQLSIPSNSSTAGAKLPADQGSMYLLIDDDGDFSTGPTPYRMTLVGDNWVTNFTPSADTYFTFATGHPQYAGPAPGGVFSGLAVWLKADAGTNNTNNGGNVTSWSDQSGNGNDASGIGTVPTYIVGGENYNPALSFNSTSGGMIMGNDPEINTSASALKTIAMAFRTGSDVNTRQILFEQGGINTGVNMYLDGGSLNCNLFVNDADNVASTPVDTNTSYMVIFVYNGNDGRWDCYVNGTLAMSDASVPSSLPTDNHGVGIGYVNDQTQFAGNVDAWNNNGFVGRFMEFAYYNNNALDSAARSDVFSYLGTKYGVSIDGDYSFAQNGSVFWDQSSNPSYSNDIAGIARDDASALHQKQARSESADGLVSVGLGTVATDNASNANSFSNDQNALMWGNDDHNISFVSSGAPSGRSILDRTWKMQSTGSFGNLMFQVPDDGSAASPKLPSEDGTVYLLLDSDDDFSSGAVETSMNLVGNNWQGVVSVSGYSYFTFATGPFSSTLTADLSVTQNGDENGPTDIILTVTLSDTNNTGGAITFDIDDLGTGSAISDSDYVGLASGAQISVANGATYGTFAISVIDDGRRESSENVDFAISNASHPKTSIGTANATASISDNEPPYSYDDVILWLKADAGVVFDGSRVDAWYDQSGNNINTWVGDHPDVTYDSAISGYSPGVKLNNGANVGTNNAGMNMSSAKRSAAIAFRTDSDINNRQVLFEQGSSSDGINFFIESGSLFVNFFTGSGDNVGSVPIAPNTSYVLIFVYDGTGNYWNAYLNGTLVMSDNSVPSSVPTNWDNAGIGGIEGSTRFPGWVNASSGNSYRGHIMEFLYYTDRVLDFSTRGDLFSYLGTKYAVTIDGDYTFAEGGAATWTQSANAAYHHDVAGIGRDDATSLHQKQSISSNDDALVSIGLGTVAENNFVNPNNFSSDKTGLMWGNDDGDVSVYTATGAPSGQVILDRVWKYKATGSVGNLQIRVPGNSSSQSPKLPPGTDTVFLLLDSDIDFSSGATAIPMTRSGDDWVTTFTPSSRVYFTFATGPLLPQYAPGGVVDNLILWLKADKATSTTTNNTALSTWTDLSAGGNDAVDDGNPPLFLDNQGDNINFYPTVDFDGNDDRLVVDLSSIKNSNYTMLGVGIREDNSFNVLLGSEGGSGNQDLHFGYRNANSATLAQWGNDLDLNGLDAYNNPALTPFMLFGSYDGSGRVLEETRNGAFGRATDGNTTDISGNKTNYIGELGSVTNYNGRISEVVVYDAAVTDLEKQRIYSYLALKYGMMLTPDLDNDGNLNESLSSGGISEGDWVASDGSRIFWDYSVMGGSYYNDIAGIGLDTLSGLDHRQSTSAGQDAIVTIGLGNIASSNAANANAFNAHLDFLMWGNDDGSLSGVASNSSLPAQSGMTDRLQRTWKIAETGNVGQVQVAVPKAIVDAFISYPNYGNLYLRVADDENLSSNVTDVLLSEATINGTQSYVADHDFDGIKYFGFVQKDFIVWTGAEWRGGLSAVTPHAPSDEAGDAVKPLYVLAGDTADIAEAVVVDDMEILTGATLAVKPLSCLRTSGGTNDGSFILQADATGFGQYKGPAVEATVQQFADNSGWHHIGSPFSNATWADLSFKDNNGFVNHPVSGSSTDSCNYCNLWWYDTSTDGGEDIGFMSSTAYGTWRTSSDVSEAFTADRGWNLFFDEAQNFGSAPWTFSFTGTLNDAPVSQTVNENNSGWNLVANPYASVLDWDEVDEDLASEGIAPGYHIWDHANTNFATYANGAGTLGAGQYIAPMQGFYVQTSVVGAQNSNNVYHSFRLTPNDVPDACQTAGGNIFKSTSAVTDHLRIRTRHLGSGKIDEMVIRFADGANRAFESGEDIRKLLTTYGDVPSVFVDYGKDFTAITSLPFPTARDSVFVSLHCNNGSMVELKAMDVPAGMEAYLEDLKTGKWYSLRDTHVFTHDKQLERRFLLHYSPFSIEPKDWTYRNPFNIHIEDGSLVLKTLKRIDDAEWYLTSVSGAVVAHGRVDADTGARQTLDVSNFAPGIYVFVLFDGEEKYSEKLPKVH